MWAGYDLDGEDVGFKLRLLRTHGLVHLPLLGPPRLTIDGETALENWP